MSDHVVAFALKAPSKPYEYPFTISCECQTKFVSGVALAWVHNRHGLSDLGFELTDVVNRGQGDITDL